MSVGSGRKKYRDTVTRRKSGRTVSVLTHSQVKNRKGGRVGMVKCAYDCSTVVRIEPGLTPVCLRKDSIGVPLRRSQR